MTDPDLLVSRTHSHPHDYLGAHPDGKGVVVRVFRPDARQVLVVPEGCDPVAAKAVHPGGVFEAALPKASLPLRYRVDVDYGQGARFTLDDPYRFLPTLGEVDLT